MGAHDRGTGQFEAVGDLRQQKVATGPRHRPCGNAVSSTRKKASVKSGVGTQPVGQSLHGMKGATAALGGVHVIAAVTALPPSDGRTVRFIGCWTGGNPKAACVSRAQDREGPPLIQQELALMQSETGRILAVRDLPAFTPDLSYRDLCPHLSAVLGTSHHGNPPCERKKALKAPDNNQRFTQKNTCMRQAGYGVHNEGNFVSSLCTIF